MATQYKTRAFVFSKSDRNDADRFFSVFTENFGKLDIFAKAIRKITSKLKSNIDIFYLSEIEFVQGKFYKTLIDSSALKNFNCAGNLNKQKIINRISFLLDSFIKGQEKDNSTFDFLLKFLESLKGQEKIKNHKLIYQYFFWNFISLQGFKIEVDECVFCRKKMDPENIYFSNKEGGVICKNCNAKNCNAKINSDIVKILRLIFKKDFKTILKLKIESSSMDLLEELSENAIHLFCPANS